MPRTDILSMGFAGLVAWAVSISPARPAASMTNPQCCYIEGTAIREMYAPGT